LGLSSEIRLARIAEKVGSSVVPNMSRSEVPFNPPVLPILAQALWLALLVAFTPALARRF